MSSRAIKKEVLRILDEKDLDTISQAIRQYPERDLINPLFSGLFRVEERIRWHAVSIFGEVLARLADQDMEAARIVMRRFLWSLNDESGGIGWGAPEAMAEAMVSHERIREEYLHMLISYMREDGPLLHQDGNFIELPELQRGLLWGIGRLAENHRELLLQKGVAADLILYLGSEDGQVRGLAARCLGMLEPAGAISALEKMSDDQTAVNVYSDGKFFIATAGELARQALRNVMEAA